MVTNKNKEYNKDYQYYFKHKNDIGFKGVKPSMKDIKYKDSSKDIIYSDKEINNKEIKNNSLVDDDDLELNNFSKEESYIFEESKIPSRFISGREKQESKIFDIDDVDPNLRKFSIEEKNKLLELIIKMKKFCFEKEEIEFMMGLI